PARAAVEIASVKAGQPDLGIAAVVGDEAISSYDVENRLRFIISTARLASTPDVLKVIRPQVIRSLIDEKLQERAAAASKVKISDAEVADAMAAIEQQRGMPPGTIGQMLKQNGVPEETFKNQIRAQLAWNQVLSKKVRPNVHVSEEEVTIAARKFSMEPPKKKATTPQEYKIGVIALPIEKPGQEKTIGALAFKLVQQIRAGASFEEVSRQFSSVAASAGGKVETFWVRLGQLDAGIAQSLAEAQAGTVTNPVRTSQGYTIVKVYETRDIPGKKAKEQPKPQEEVKDTEVTFKEILLKLKPDANEQESEVMLQIGGEVAKNPGTCEEATVASIDSTKDFDIDVGFKNYLLSEMPDGLKDFADQLKQGEISPPLITYEGIRLYMLCGKHPS
ncbi:MAG: hypothetical protein EBV03_13415, partial [Proteobacteria bacterium]|nr:hypothetical protein [Pseudomonadota bacterium]